MSSRLGRVTTGLAVAALAVPALAVANGRGHGHGHGETFTVFATEVTDQFFDAGAPGPSPGDRAVFATSFTRQGGPSGVAGGSCK